MTKATQERSILIIGGGIAGTTTALALHKVGLSAEIYEARDDRSDGVGAFLTLAGNGVRALATLGLDLATVPGIDTPAMQLGLGSGVELARLPLDAVETGITRTVKRSDLYGALRAKARELDIPIHYGKRLVDATTTADGVTATFDDGTEASGTALIGADGLHSRTRTIIDPNAPSPRYLGVLNAGGYAHGIDVGSEPGIMHMTFGEKTFFSWIATGTGDIWWFANPPQRTEPQRGELAAIPQSTWRQILLDLVEGDTSPATRIIDASSDLFAPWPTHDFPSVPTWHRGNLLIIGDAAHAASPSSGQGASMAIEDAAALAIALRDAPSVPLAFAAFEALRRPRVTRIVAQGKRNGNGKTPGRFGRAIRDAGLRLVFSRPPRNQAALGWLYDYPIDWVAGTAGGVPVVPPTLEK